MNNKNSYRKYYYGDEVYNSNDVYIKYIVNDYFYNSVNDFNGHNKLYLIPYDIFKNKLNEKIEQITNLTPQSKYNIYFYYLLDNKEKNERSVEYVCKIFENIYMYLKIVFNNIEKKIIWDKNILFISNNISLLFALSYPKQDFYNNKDIKNKILLSFNKDGISIIPPAVFVSYYEDYKNYIINSPEYIKLLRNNRDICKHYLLHNIHSQQKTMLYYFITYIETFKYLLCK